MKSKWTAVLAAATFLVGISAPRAEPSREAVTRRVEGLLARMTLDEKIGQLNLMSNGLAETAVALDASLASGRVGALMNFATPSDVAEAQSKARNSRLGIPLLFGLDVLRGFRTMFPVPIGEASSFDPDLARRNAEAIAREARASGVNWTFAPMADLARDPRWGRIVEGFGEDPTVGRLFTAARVTGFRAGGLATTLKHFAGYGAPVGGRDYDTTAISSTDLFDNYLPPFRAGIEAGAESVMSAFNALNGLPSTANPFLLTEVLRKRWGYGGFVVSDWAAIEELIAHGIARDGAEAARKALLAGVDMDMQSELYSRHLPDEVAAKRVPLSAIDAATRRVLTVKAKLGLFDAPDLQLGAPTPGPRPESREAARIAARDSMVLLRNEGALPIARGRKVAFVGGIVDNRYDLIGPHAARVNYEDGPSLLEAVRARAAGSDVTISYAPGCDVVCKSDEGFAAALETARAADLVVAVMGESTEITGEAASRATLDLPGRQRALLDALLDTGKPVVLVLVASRPLDIGPALSRLGALMMAWFRGRRVARLWPTSCSATTRPRPSCRSPGRAASARCR
jgi:beta-glucosidase